MKKAETKPAAKAVKAPAEPKTAPVGPQTFNYMELDLGRYLSPWMQGVLYAASCHERFGTPGTRKALDEAIDGK